MKQFTPPTLFEDVDFDYEFEPTIIKQQTVDNTTIQHFYINGRRCGDAITRIYGVLAYQTASAPVIIVVGEVGKAIDISLLEYWATNGFVAVSIDYAGDIGIGFHTVYPLATQYANLNKAGRHLKYVDTTARDTSWYEYDFSTRRIIQYMLNNYCQNNLIGICSLGGIADKIAIHTLATCKELLCGAIIFGSLWDKVEEISPDLNIDKLTNTIEALDQKERWLSGICSQSYLQYVSQPIYLLTGVNSTKTNILDNNQGLYRCKNICSQALYINGLIDIITPNVLENIKNWFLTNFSNQQSTLKKPKVSFNTRKGQLYAKVSNFKDVTISYTVSDISGSALSWRRANIVQEGSNTLGFIDVFDINSTITVLATVNCNGVFVSSDPHTILANKYKIRVKNKSRIFYQNASGLGNFLPLVYDQNSAYTSFEPLSVGIGAYGISGICGKHFGTFEILEYAFNERDSYIMLDIYSAIASQVTLCIITNWASANQCAYSKSLQLCGGRLWQKTKIDLTDLKSPQGKPFDIADIHKISLLLIDADQQIILNNILFG
ncbi:MAG: hypothetical protein RR248_01475 [Clostridia bacterium]